MKPSRHALMKYGHMPRRGLGKNYCEDPVLSTFTSYSISPPNGYTFIPKDDVYITRNCRELTKQAMLPQIVILELHTEKRVGLHCRTEIYEAVIEDAVESAGHCQQAVNDMESRNQEYVKALIHQCFPRIPETSSLAILKHIHLKGTGRDGRSAELENEVKIRLAVNAHIRHEFTTYDLLCNQAHANDPHSDLIVVRDLVSNEVKRIAESWRAEALSVTNEVKDNVSKHTVPTKMSGSKAETLIEPLHSLNLDGKKITRMPPKNNGGDKLTVTSSVLEDALEKKIKEKERVARPRDGDSMIIDNDDMIIDDDYNMIIDDEIRITKRTRR